MAGMQWRCGWFKTGTAKRAGKEMLKENEKLCHTTGVNALMCVCVCVMTEH